MNQQRYRIVFNRVRGQRVVVSEATANCGKGANRTTSVAESNGAGALQESAAPDSRSLTPRPLAHALIALGLSSALLLSLPGGAHAQITPHPDAATHQKPGLEQAGNGVPVVQIVPPDRHGNSHNIFGAFNVDARGGILNNSRTITQTQLGGYLGGNPNLERGGPAQRIIGEVRGTDPSRLAGWLEIAGARAGLILANPNGVFCNGCGFLNTHRITLTTGVPWVAADGAFGGVRVTRGWVEIGPNGLNGSNLDQLDLIARSVRINGELWAGGKLNVVAGANQVDYATLGVQVIAGEGAPPTVAIDSAHLGGMYANSIYLIGTEKGVGVNLAGEIMAQGEDVTMDAAGNVRYRDTVSLAS